jgi:GNAT superfamily N-acetyltransferase
VKYRPEFKNQLVELQKHLWSSDVTVNAAYLEWKYERNPYINTPLIYLALCAGKVVGMRGMCGARWQIGDSGQTFRVPIAGDLVIAPDHRNQGLYTKIMKAALTDLVDTDYRYVFNLSANPLNLLGSLTMGWRSIGHLQPMHRKSYRGVVLNRLQRYANKLSFLPSVKRRNPFDFLDRKALRDQGKVGLHVSVERAPRPQAMAELVERTTGDGRIRHVRDQEYFAWRFNNPLSSYRFLFWGKTTRIEGYLIMRSQLYNETFRVNIVDWEATNPQVRSDLLEAAVRLQHSHSLRIWTATLPGAVKSLLQKKGFKLLTEAKSISRYRPTVLLRPVRDDMLKTDWLIAGRSLLDMGNWDLRMIYSDGN